MKYLLISYLVYHASSHMALTEWTRFRGSSAKSKEFLSWSGVIGKIISILILILLFYIGPWWLPLVAYAISTVITILIPYFPFYGLVFSLIIWATVIADFIMYFNGLFPFQICTFPT